MLGSCGCTTRESWQRFRLSTETSPPLRGDPEAALQGGRRPAAPLLPAIPARFPMGGGRAGRRHRLGHHLGAHRRLNDGTVRRHETPSPGKWQAVVVGRLDGLRIAASGCLWSRRPARLRRCSSEGGHGERRHGPHVNRTLDRLAAGSCCRFSSPGEEGCARFERPLTAVNLPLIAGSATLPTRWDVTQSP